LLPSISLLADEDVAHREEDFLALAERADAALAEMRAMEAPADPQEVVKFMASLAERRGFDLPSPTALAMDARAVAARIPADLLPLALERIWGDFAYRRLPEPPDFAKAVEAELRDRREAAAKVHTVALKARHARWLKEKRRDADTRHATEKERERAWWEAMRPAVEEDPRPSSLPRSEGLPVVDPELRRGDLPEADVAEVASEVEANPSRPGDLPDTAGQPEQGYEIHTGGTSGNDHGCVDDPPVVAFRDGALAAVSDIGADLDGHIAGPVEDNDHPARAGGKRLDRAKAVRREAGDPPDGAAPTPVSGDTELWRKLGDDEVRKVAYRGRCLTPARTSTRERYAMNEDNGIVRLRQPNAIGDPLTALLRSGTRRLLEQAIEAEVAAFLTSMKELKLPDGRDRVVRHGHGPERVIQTRIGPVEVQRIKVRDRAPGPVAERIRFSSALLPHWARRTTSLDALLPILYLRGVSAGDFQEALGVQALRSCLCAPGEAGAIQPVEVRSG
jgi:hypothetical protein